MIKKPRTVMARTAIRQRLNAAAAASDGGGSSGVVNWNYTTVKVAVGEAEARLRAEALERDRLRDTGPPTAREKAVLKAVSDALLSERQVTQNRQSSGGSKSDELAMTVNKLEQRTGLAVDSLEEKVNSLESRLAELRQELLTLNSRPSAPRTLLITHADGTTSTLTETLADEAKDDDMLKPPPQP